jgi:beta-lactamase class D
VEARGVTERFDTAPPATLRRDPWPAPDAARFDAAPPLDVRFVVEPELDDVRFVVGPEPDAVRFVVGPELSAARFGAAPVPEEERCVPAPDDERFEAGPAAEEERAVPEERPAEEPVFADVREGGPAARRVSPERRDPPDSSGRPPRFGFDPRLAGMLAPWLIDSRCHQAPTRRRRVDKLTTIIPAARQRCVSAEAITAGGRGGSSYTRGQDMRRPFRRYAHAPLALLLAIAAPRRHAGDLRFPDIDARGEAVVLIADARSGQLLGGAGLGNAHVHRYPPGSLFKLAIAVAAIEAGRCDPHRSYRCAGAAVFDGRTQRCWLPRGHGRIDFEGAIAQSCNLYFLDLAHHLPEQSIISSAQRLGLLPASAAPTHLSDSILLGQSIPVAPYDLLETGLVLASRGRVGSSPGPLSAPRFRPLYDGLRACVRIGTGREAWSRRIATAGKTGTAGMPEAPRRNVGWFIGFAPANHPRYVIVVMLKDGEGAKAAALAGELLGRIM